MAGQQVNLLPVDVADIIILVDNSLDILLPSDKVEDECGDKAIKMQLGR